MFKILYDSLMTREAKKKGLRIYKRNPVTGLWDYSKGGSYRLEDHGRGRLDMIKVPADPEPETATA